MAFGNDEKIDDKIDDKKWVQKNILVIIKLFFLDGCTICGGCVEICNLEERRPLCARLVLVARFSFVLATILGLFFFYFYKHTRGNALWTTWSIVKRSKVKNKKR